MASIYIHIPYCRQACYYCNFHFSTFLKTKSELLSTIASELVLRKDYLGDEKIKTIYFGGGTPSLLETSEIKNILETIYQNYDVESDGLEITLEGNPDDLTYPKLQDFFKAGINRLSIGVQSFHDHDLKLLNRVHNAGQSKKCLEDAKQAGFENITIDLIYGIQEQTDEQWIDNLEQLKTFNLPHFSAYSLTIEPKTALEKMIRKGEVENTDDDQSASQFILLQNWAEQNKYIPYEISNYCLPGHFSRHNTGYWTGEKYLGIGPSAHSFNGISRQWNIANNNLYIKNINQGDSYFEIEHLSNITRYNEYVMTSLRTVWGCDLNVIKERFGLQFANAIMKSAAYYVSENLLFVKDDVIRLTLAGKLLADKIISELFVLNSSEI